jgi:RNA polymerase sigma-70 factor (ECF subfamily)
MRSCPVKSCPATRRAPSDAELIERACAGESAQYGVLVARYHRRLYCVALRILKDEADAEDALQDAYILAFTRLAQFAGRSSFFTWMSRITINEAFTRIRLRRRSQRLATALEVPDAVERLYQGVRTPEQQAIHTQFSEVLDTSVRSLPPRYRTVFVVREVQEMSTFEAAAVLGISEECVKTRLHRARELLKTRMARRTRPWRERAA